uniref:Uncharacterized protein n=1 Tax=viral metagenome TaxID=1070528 RepID=A0A6C0H746_9ZZZZ
MTISLKNRRIIDKILNKYRPKKKIVIKQYKKNKGDKFKKIFNKKINYYLKKNNITHKSRSIILDSKYLNTSKVLLKCGFKKSKITSVEYDKNTSIIHCNFGIKSVNSLLHDYLEKINNKYIYNNLIFDFQGHIINYAYSALLAIVNDYISDNTLLILTFCKRCGTKGVKYHISKNDFLKSLTKISTIKGFTFYILEEFSYYSKKQTENKQTENKQKKKKTVNQTAMESIFIKFNVI